MYEISEKYKSAQAEVMQHSAAMINKKNFFFINFVGGFILLPRQLKRMVYK